MKKSLCLLMALLLFSLSLTSCGFTMPRPELKEGEFDVSVIYEVGGETKTLDLVYVCEYDGIATTVDGTHYRAWKGHFKEYEDGETFEVYTAEDGSKIGFNFLIYAEYFMGEPDYVDDFCPHILTERIYFEDGIEMIDSNGEFIAEN